MSAGFLVAFGGVLLVVAVFLVIEALIVRPKLPHRRATPSDVQADIDASLAEAQVAAKRAETEIAKVRARIAL
jgi:hypothetical protein